jgi:hypothetical protein
MDSSDFLKKQEEDEDIRLFQDDYPFQFGGHLTYFLLLF